MTKIISTCDKFKNLNCEKNWTVVIAFFFSKNNFNTLTTDEMFEGQRFAILAMFITNPLNQV